MSMIVPASEYLARFLDATGDGTGSSDGAVDGSVTNVTLKADPPAGFAFAIEQLSVTIEDATAVIWAGYGAIAAPGLTNGILLRVVEGSTVELDLLDGIPVQRTAHWAKFASRKFSEGEVANFFATFHMFFEPYLLVEPDRALEFVIRDDLSGLLKHEVYIRGKQIARSVVT